MTFTLQDLKHLEIMAELEERPASPPEEPTVVEAHVPTTLTEKLLTLASRLRVAGFIQQAESLESTFGMYKKAEQDANLLYRAHSETGDDLLEFAHPDGDIEIAPAQDHHGDVETPISQHKKIIDVARKSAVLGMLRESLGVKTAQVPGSRPASQHDMAGFAEFKLIVSEIIDTLGGAFTEVFQNPKYDVTFVSGMTTRNWAEKLRVLRYKLDESVSLYGQFISGNGVGYKSKALSAPDMFLKGCVEFSQDIIDSMAKDVVKLTPKESKEKGFDNVTFAPQVQRKVTNLQHRWYKFWGTYGDGKKEDTDAHGKFLTHGQVKEMVDSAKVKLNSLLAFINEYFLKAPEVQGAPAVATYLNGLVGFIKGVEANFDSIVAQALKFTNGVPSPLGGNTEMTTENIKSFITDKEFASKLDLSNNQTFMDSIDSVIQNIMTNLVKLVKENKAFETVRATALSTLNSRIDAVRKK